MLFKSAYADFQVLVRSESILYHPATGVEIGRTKPLIANFGTHGGTFTSPDPMTGALEEHAIIHGHYFDSEQMAEERGWSEEEHESVVAAILKICREQPYLVAQVELEVIRAEKPWPTYDEATAKNIVDLAVQLGLVREALAYERENKQRSTLIAELEDIATKAEKTQEPAAITL